MSAVANLSRCGIGLLALLAPAVVARAEAPEGYQPGWMKRDEIVEAFVDRQLSGVYPSGAPWTELVRRDGTSDYQEGQRRREGRWWMSGDHFCFAYGLPQTGGCFQVVRLGSNCYDLYAVGAGGEAEVPPARALRSWNGRMWREDEPATCQGTPTS